MSLEYCIVCDELTGRAGKYEDSLYSDDLGLGPLCEECFEELNNRKEHESVAAAS